LNARTHDPLPDCELITDAGRVARLLERLARRYTPLTVQIPGHKDFYTSCIVDVDNKHVLLDELLPNTGHQLFMAERNLLVKGKIEGIDIQFTATLKKVEDQGGMLTYHMTLPNPLEYRQRRMAYRVHIPVTSNLDAIIENRNGEMVKGMLHDLSFGGAGVIFPVRQSVMGIGCLHECAVQLPDDEWIYCTAELRYSKEIKARGTQLLGVQFLDLTPMQTRHIGRCISQLEREIINKYAVS